MISDCKVVQAIKCKGFGLAKIFIRCTKQIPSVNELILLDTAIVSNFVTSFIVRTISIVKTGIKRGFNLGILGNPFCVCEREVTKLGEHGKAIRI